MAKYDYSGLDAHFKEQVSLTGAKENVAEAACLLTMLITANGTEERASYADTIANCLYEYSELLKCIKEPG